MLPAHWEGMDGSEWVLVGSRAFKACVGRLARPRWVRFPHVPASFKGASFGEAPLLGSRLWTERMLRRRAHAAAALLAIWLIVPPIAQAQEAMDEGTGRPPAGLSEATAGPFDAPTWVALRSLVIPGWGQAKNGAWLKALFVAGVQIAFIERLVFENRMVHEYRDKALDDPSEAAFYKMKAERHESHRRDFIWWTSLWVALSMGDAYVDAHLRDFDVRLQAEPSTEPGGGDESVGLAVRVSLGLRF